jgi:hypothetical protein
MMSPFEDDGNSDQSKPVNFPLTDINGVRWDFDGRRVFAIYAEGWPDNGYFCDTEDQAIQILINGGYMEANDEN